MSILSDFEDSVSRAVEGVFAGVFRSPVQPAELAKRSPGRWIADGRSAWARSTPPTSTRSCSPPRTTTKLGGFAETLAGELATYLVGYARERDYDLASKPVVRFLVDDELKLGRFDVIGELLSPEEIRRDGRVWQPVQRGEQRVDGSPRRATAGFGRRR